MSLDGIDEMLRLDCCDDAVQKFVEQRLVPRFQVGGLALGDNAVWWRGGVLGGVLAGR